MFDWFILLIGVLILVPVFSVVLGVPFMPTHINQAKKMIELAGLKPGMTVIDLGSGAGRLLFLAAQKNVKVIGYELNPFLFFWTKIMIWKKGLKDVEVKFESLYKADLKNADVVLAFLYPSFMQKLESKLFSEMKPGATIISYAFPIQGRTAQYEKDGIIIYKIPS